MPPPDSVASAPVSMVTDWSGMAGVIVQYHQERHKLPSPALEACEWAGLWNRNVRKRLCTLYRLKALRLLLPVTWIKLVLEGETHQNVVFQGKP